MLPALTPASEIACRHGPSVRSIRFPTNLLQAGAAERLNQVLRAAGVGRDERQVDFRLQRAGQLDLGALGRVAQPLQGHPVLGQVDPGFRAELRDQPAQDGFVEVVTAQERVAVGGQYLEDAGAQVEDGDVEGATAQIEHGDLGIGLLSVDAVGQRGRGGFVDDALHVQASDLPGVDGGLTLGVVEVGRYGDDRLGDPLAQLGLGVLAHFLQDHAGDLGRRVVLAGHLHMGISVVAGGDLVGQALGGVLNLGVAETPSHQPLHGKDGVVGVGDGLSLGRLTHVPLAAAGVDRNHGGRDAVPLGALNHVSLTGFDHRSHRVGRAEVDA